MDTKQKGNVVIVTIIIIAFVIIGAGVYLSTKNKQVPNVNTNTQATSTIQTADWKRYDSGRSFEFYYPKDWEAQDQSYTSASGSHLGASFQSPIRYDIPGYERVGVRYLLQLSFDKNKVSVNSESFIKVHQPGDQAVENIVLNDSMLKNSLEYKTAQTIISTAKVWTKTSN